MTKEEAQAWRDRWRLVNEFTIEEARATPMRERFRDLETLFAFAHSIKGPDALDADGGVREVRRRWTRLRAPTDVR